MNRIAANNPNVLFVVKPHPDDCSLYDNLKLICLDNIAVLDDVTLVSIDWPTARLVAAVDGVITSFSTLILDACAARTPFVVMPFDSEKIIDPKVYFPVSSPFGDFSELPVIDYGSWVCGSLPDVLDHPCFGDQSFFESSESFFTMLCECSPSGNQEQLDLVKRRLADAILEVSATINFDDHPHRERNSLTVRMAEHLQANSSSQSC